MRSIGIAGRVLAGAVVAYFTVVVTLMAARSAASSVGDPGLGRALELAVVTYLAALLVGGWIRLALPRLQEPIGSDQTTGEAFAPVAWARHQRLR